MNWAAAVVLANQIPATPLIAIDDALVGIAMQMAGFGKETFVVATMFKSWGFPVKDEFGNGKETRIFYTVLGKNSAKG